MFLIRLQLCKLRAIRDSFERRLKHRTTNYTLARSQTMVTKFQFAISCASFLLTQTAWAEACAVRTQPLSNAHTLTVSSATYFGRGAADAIFATEFSPDCTLLVAGRITNAANTFTDVTNVGNPLVNGTTGSVARFSTAGTTLIARSVIGSQINDMAVSDASGDVALASDVALVVLASDLSSVRWSVSGGTNRVAMTADGRVAALFGKTLRVYTAAGARLFELTLGDAMVNDVAIDAASGLVFVTGMAQRDGGSCSQLQVAWIRAYELSSSGTLRWRAYDYPTRYADQHGDCADARGRLVAMGRDGKLYFGGTSAGGNSMFRWTPQTRASTDPPLVATAIWPSAANVQTGNDYYVNPFNTRSNHITYVARFDPASGRHEMGFFLLSRLGIASDSNGNGNTIEPRAIAADETGRVYVGGFSAYQLKNRENATINGVRLAAYAGEDAWLLITSADYAQRDTWIAFNNGGKGTVYGVAARGNAVAIGVGVTVAPLFVTANAVQTSPPSSTTTPAEKSGYLAAFPVTAASSPCWFDLDGDGQIAALRDGLALIRTAQSVAAGNVFVRTGIASASQHIARTRATLAISTQTLDVDGNGIVEAATDGVILLRGMLGLKGDALIAGALGVAPPSGVWRNTGALIEAHLAANCVR